MTKTGWGVGLALVALAIAADAQPAAQQTSTGARVVATCDFEGPYSAGEQQIHSGCVNNWQWGKKDMALKAERDAGRPGTVQSIHVRGITSGGMQFFFTRLKLKKDRYYRVTFWMKGDGLESAVNVLIRKGGYPWTCYVGRWSGMPAGEWKQYSFSAKCSEDVNDDVGVMWETGSVGKIWLDDLVVEESDQPFDVGPVAAAPAPTGNLLIRSSCEGNRDYLWCTGVYGQWVQGVWRGADAEWEDPQAYRATGGKFGKYCMAIPASTHGGTVFTRSTLIDVIPGRPYTFSVWVRADHPKFPVNIAFLYFGSKEPGVSKTFTVGQNWQRCAITGTAKATASNQVFLQVAPPAKPGTVFADGFQFEAGESATDYKPRYPLELYADVGQAGGNLFEWGQTVPLSVYAAAADAAPLSKTDVEITVTGYPDVVVWRKVVGLAVGEPQQFPLELKRRGIFRVSLRAVNGTDAAPQEVLFALVPRPRPTEEASSFGTHITVRPFFVDYVRRLGIKWTRFHDACVITKWAFAEPERGKYYWHDEIVEGIRKGGLHILALPDRPPKWACAEKGAANVIDLPAFGKYCEEAARHYRGKIGYWEIWNEPYMPDFFGGSAQQFGEVMKVAYPALKRGNPEAKILGWCADISHPRFGELLPEEARRSIDIFSFHQYVLNLAGSGTLPFAGELEVYRRLLGPKGPRECWNTEGNNGEIGGNSFYTFLPVTRELNDRAIAFASRVWIEHAKAGIGKFFVYQMHQTDSIMYFGGYKMWIGYDRSVTPAAVATATTAYCMDGLKTVPFKAIPGVLQGLFAGDGRATWVVYDDSGVPGRRRLDLAQLPRDAEVLDVMGNDPRVDGRMGWEIGQQPLFVMSGRLGAEELLSIGQRAAE